MNAPRTGIAMVALSALIPVGCDAVLGIHVLDGAGTVDAAGQTTGADATLGGRAASDGSTDAPPGDDVAFDAGTDASAPSDARISAPDACCTITFGTNDACAACARTSCPGELDTCAGDPVVCAPYESCLGNCNGDPACRSQCTIDHPVPSTSSAAVSGLSACLAGKCENECGLTCGAFAGYLSEPAAAAACQSCLNTSNGACVHARACGSSAECDAYWRCYLACPTPDCKFACALDHDAGAALLRPLQLDYSTSCAGPCAFGNYWACVGHVNWPPAQSPTVAFTVPVIDFTSHLPVAGEIVSICASCPCGTSDDPLLGDSGTTDDAGTVTLTVRNEENSSGVGMSGCVQVTSPGDATVPYYGYWGYPLTEPTVNPASGPGSSITNLLTQSVQTFTPEELDGAIGYAQVVQLPSRGLIGAAVFDCLANRAPGVEVTINNFTDPLVTTFYAIGDAGATTREGLAFLYNVPPRVPVQLIAKPASLDGGVSSFETVVVDVGTTTAVGMFPTPFESTLPTP